MINFPQQIQMAIESFSKLSGVGEKTALRQIMGMLNWNSEEVEKFSFSIKELNKIKYCTKCGLFSEEEICYICKNSSRIESKVICVVENISDLMAIENSGQFSGYYHILGGVLNPLLGIGPDQLKINQLIENTIDQGVESVILAVSPSVEGDATCSYIKQLLNENIKVERIGFGVPMGGSIEYLDPLTIGKALENRRSL